MRGDLVTGIVGLALAVFYLSQTYSIKIFGGAGAVVDARTVPKVWGVGLAVLSIALICRSLYNIYKKRQQQKKSLRDVLDAVRNKREVVYTFVLLILYAVLMEPLGFIISSILYVLLQIVVLTPVDKRGLKVWKMAGLLAVVFSVGLYYLFTQYFMVMLPAGILKF